MRVALFALILLCCPVAHAQVYDASGVFGSPYYYPSPYPRYYGTYYRPYYHVPYHVPRPYYAAPVRNFYADEFLHEARRTRWAIEDAAFNERWRAYQPDWRNP